MSYDDTHCPCGGLKERETMLCSDCVAAFAGSKEYVLFCDKGADLTTRRELALEYQA